MLPIYRHKRTLQRRVEQWRALHGPAHEGMFMQPHRAGPLVISDFTRLRGEPITIAGQVLEHRLFHFRLPYSGWCHVTVIYGVESFVALSEALQTTRALCGEVSAEHRTDSLSVYPFLGRIFCHVGTAWQQGPAPGVYVGRACAPALISGQMTRPLRWR